MVSSIFFSALSFPPGAPGPAKKRFRSAQPAGVPAPARLPKRVSAPAGWEGFRLPALLPPKTRFLPSFRLLKLSIAEKTKETSGEIMMIL